MSLFGLILRQSLWTLTFVSKRKFIPAMFSWKMIISVTKINGYYYVQVNHKHAQLKINSNSNLSLDLIFAIDMTFLWQSFHMGTKVMAVTRHKDKTCLNGYMKRKVVQCSFLTFTTWDIIIWNLMINGNGMSGLKN